MEKGNTFDLFGFISFILLVGVFYFNNLIVFVTLVSLGVAPLILLC